MFISLEPFVCVPWLIAQKTVLDELCPCTLTLILPELLSVLKRSLRPRMRTALCGAAFSKAGHEMKLPSAGAWEEPSVGE